MQAGKSLVWVGCLCLLFWPATMQAFGKQKEAQIPLPQPSLAGDVSVESALYQIRPAKKYSLEPLGLKAISQLLWAAQGIVNKKTGQRTAPSVLNFYMLDVYLIADQVSGLAPGLYKYQPKKHQLQVIAKGEIKRQMYKSLGHGELKAAPALIVVVGLRIRTPKPEWMYLEAGHAAQNIYLQATALGLSINAVTGFKETRARKTLRLLPQEIPIYILPVSKKVE